MTTKTTTQHLEAACQHLNDFRAARDARLAREAADKAPKLTRLEGISERTAEQGWYHG